MPSKTKPTKAVWRREVMAWCCYDWANSGYTTLMITIFAVYLQKTVFSVETSGSTGAIVWAWGVAISMLIGALLSPFAGALADAKSGKRFGLATSAIVGSFSCMAMAVAPPEQTWLVTGFFLLANISLELSLTFYNGFLPEIASEDEMNRVSAAGMGWGYLGGGLCLLLALLLLSFGKSLGLGEGPQLLRLCVFLTGVWWLVFSLPTILFLQDKPRARLDTNASFRLAARNSIGDVIATLKQFRIHRTLGLFLIAFLFYNDGVQTVISQSSTFAIHEIGFSDKELVAVILMVQFVATPGAIATGWLADKTGSKNALILCLCVWIILLASAWFIQSKAAYWCMAVGVALVLGGTQAISRAIMGTLTPRGHEARYFGFFNLSGKATSFMGTFVFGLIIALSGSSRLAIVNLLVFFIVGLVIVVRINLDRGKADRELAQSEHQPSDTE